MVDYWAVHLAISNGPSKGYGTSQGYRPDPKAIGRPQAMDRPKAMVRRQAMGRPKAMGRPLVYLKGIVDTICDLYNLLVFLTQTQD